MRAIIALFLGLLVACTPVYVADSPEPKAEIADLVERTVKLNNVCISEDGSFYSSSGSGAIIKSGIYGSTVVTAKHVVDDKNCITSVKDQYSDEWMAYNIRTHEKADIAVLDIIATYSLPPLKVGKPRYDQELITLGYPYDIMVRRTVFTITRGTTAASYEGKTFFRMTAPVLPGASGSAVYDYRTGALVGVVSMYYPLSGQWKAARDAHYYAEYAAYVFDLLDQPSAPQKPAPQ